MSKDMLTRGRLNKMLKYFKGKQVSIQYHYRNSLGADRVISFDGAFDHFTIQELPYDLGATLLFKGKIVFEVDMPKSAYFLGVGSLEWLNAGPYCQLKITRKKSLFLGTPVRELGEKVGKYLTEVFAFGILVGMKKIPQPKPTISMPQGTESVLAL